MAKQRNSLGIVVLRGTNNETISWEDYKKLTGIDLEKIFFINDDGYISFKRDMSKIILLSQEGDNTDTVSVPVICLPTTISTALGGDTVLRCENVNDGTGFQIYIYPNKTINGGPF